MTPSARIVKALERIESSGLLSTSNGLNVAIGYLSESLRIHKKLRLDTIASGLECGAKHAERYDAALNKKNEPPL